MDYTHWNLAIANHFFGPSTSGKRVFFCVTSDTLAEISKLDPDEAVADFIKAVIKGPEWTQIGGCSRIGSKALNCLYPDPQWRNRLNQSREKKDLTNHQHWQQFNENTNGKPPYLAYLACFVLAWTERDDNFGGNDYYGPLNKLMGLYGENMMRSADFARTYNRGEHQISTIDLWQDLEEWGYSTNTGVCDLPKSLVDGTSYVNIPKYFGLLKASDLRNLPDLFQDLVECSRLDLGRLPTPESMVRILCDHKASNRFLTPACLSNLRSSADGVGDHVLMEAYGRLICARFRDFDGFAGDEGGKKAIHANRRCHSMLLRALSPEGKLRVVCRFRRDDPEERLIIEGDRDYAFTEGQGSRTTFSRWMRGAWFSPMDLVPVDPFAGLRSQCRELSLTAQLVPREVVAMRSWGLPYHLQRHYVEVDEIEPGRDYFLLVRGEKHPDLKGLKTIQINARAPQGASLWKFHVPLDAKPIGWPSPLPPLSEDIPKNPSIRFEGFRLRPREDIFPLHFPTFVRTSDETLEIFVKNPLNATHVSLLQTDRGWRLESKKPGRMIVALRDSETKAEMSNTEKFIEFKDLHELEQYSPDTSLVSGDRPWPIYPSSTIRFFGGTLAPVIQENPNAYLASAPPSILVEFPEQLVGKFRLRVNQKDVPINPRKATSLECLKAIGTYDLECLYDDLPTQRVKLELTSDPDFEVKGLSADPRAPKLVKNTIDATVLATTEGNVTYTVNFQIFHNNQAVPNSGGNIETGHSGVITYTDHLGLLPDRLYAIHFTSGKKTVIQWFKVRPSSGKYLSPNRGKINMLNNAFENLKLPEIMD
jgi:hypothetical protein